MDSLPRGRRRTAATGRVLLGAGRAALGRLARRSDDADRQVGEALAGELDQLKGLAMKVGQILSYLDAGIPEETARALAALQRGATPLPAEAVRAAIAASLGAPVEDLFEAFEDTPVASASVGQVHRARVRGVDVAVKVRHPGIREVLDGDTARLRPLARLASVATAVDGEALVDELRARLLEECDYRREAGTQRRFGAWLAGDLGAPAVVDDRSTDDVLTTAWVDGGPLHAGCARALSRLTWEVLFRRGVLHGDPHPGNFVAAPGRLWVLDYGCVRAFAPDRLAILRALLSAAIDGRRGPGIDAAAAFGLVPDRDRVDEDELWALLRFLVAPWTPGFAFRRDAFAAQMARFSAAGAPNARHLGFPPDWLWVHRTLLGQQAVCLRLGVAEPLGDVARAALAAPLDPSAPGSA